MDTLEFIATIVVLLWVFLIIFVAIDTLIWGYSLDDALVVHMDTDNESSFITIVENGGNNFYLLRYKQTINHCF